MLLTRLFNLLRGYLVISVAGRYPERFLTVCTRRRILIWDVCPVSPGILRCSISLRGFRLLRPIARKTGVHIKIVQKRGLPIFLARRKKRKWFVLGLSLCLLLLIAVNQFIWKLEITGCKNLSAALIREQLAECGVEVGSFRPYIDEKKLQTQMLIRVPELAWLWVDKSGSKVTVQVKERIMPPEIYDPTDFCNLVAANDGVIESMIVKNGVPMVSLGDTVRKGDVLVSGLIVSEKGVEPRQVQSEGEIYARVWHEKTKAFSLLLPHTAETGKSEKKFTLLLFGRRLPLFRSAETTFTEYNEETYEYEATVFGLYLGFGITWTKFTEQNTTYERLSEESAAEYGAIELLAAIDETAAPNSALSEKRVQHTIIDEDTIEVTVTAEYIENIAEKAR